MLSLVLPCRANGFVPPVASKVVLSRLGAKRGIRLVNYEDLCRHIRAQPAHRNSRGIRTVA